MSLVACLPLPDTDEDGIIDFIDNCPAIANENRGDADSDLSDDACDNCPNIYNLFQEDGDEDGIGSDEDNCPVVENPLQEDSDGDGLGDACDIDTDRSDMDRRSITSALYYSVNCICLIF